MKRIIVLALSVILLTFPMISCTSDTIGDKSEAVSTVYNNLSYGDDENQILDLIMPDSRHANGGVILLIHGGAWIAGDKVNEYTSPLMEAYTNTGYIIATMNYRFASDTVNADTMMEDIKSALNFIHKKAADSGINADKAMLVGWSSGGHTAELYAYKHADAADIKVTCMVAYSGVADLNRQALAKDNPLDEILGIPMTAVLSDLAGCEITTDNFEEKGEYLDKVSPITYAQTAVPTVICHSEIDTYIEYSTARELKSALDANGIENTFIDFPNSGHDLLLDPDSLELSYKALKQYAEKYIK